MLRFSLKASRISEIGWSGLVWSDAVESRGELRGSYSGPEVEPVGLTTGSGDPQPLRVQRALEVEGTG